MHLMRMHACTYAQWHVRLGLVYVRLGLVLGRHPKINLFGLHYCVICREVKTKHQVILVSKTRDKDD